MNHTTNYQLSQWAKSDQVKMEDFNADNAKIDAAIKAVDQRVDGLSASKADKTALAALTQTVAEKGNCRILTGSYMGTGSYGHTLTLGFKPKLLIVAGLTMHAVFLEGQTQTSALTYSNGGYSIDVTWTEDGLSWRSGRSQATGLDEAGLTYSYVAFY